MNVLQFVENATAHKLSGVWERKEKVGRKKGTNILADVYTHAGRRRRWSSCSAWKISERTHTAAHLAMMACFCVRSGIISSAQRFSRALREKMKWKNYFMMHACDDENPQAERHTKCHRTPHTTTAQRLDEDGKEEVEKPLVSYCKELSDLRVVAFTILEADTKHRHTHARRQPKSCARRTEKRHQHKLRRSASHDFVGKRKFSFFLSFFRFVVFFSLCSQFNL